MRGIRVLLVITGMALAVGQARAATAVVAVDPAFAPVAHELTRLFTDATGHRLELAIAPVQGLGATTADVLLAADAALPAQLAANGRAAADSLMTYAMGAAGTPSATVPRDAVLLSRGQDNPAALAFLEFLLRPEAWDVIVAHGFGAQ